MTTNTYGPVVTASWWREVAEAGVRQTFQVLLPVVVLVAAQGTLTGKDAAAAGVAAAVAFAVVVLRRVFGAVPDPASSSTVKVAYRAVSAFAGSLLGVLSAEGLDLAHLEFGRIITAAAASAVVAVIHGVLDPAATDVHAKHRAAAA